MEKIQTVAAMRELVGAWHEAGETIALVPTMGNLHAGHMSLVSIAAEHAERVVATIFVNPTQFGPNEDFEAYPRTPDMDARRLTRAGVDALFMPDVDEMYPNGTAGSTVVQVPELSDILCGAGRPGHFAGVTSVVSRLFNICAPDVAVFGQKDYQQLVILRRMTADLHLPVKIIAAPTERAESGLALSSRNAYLDDAGLRQATALSATLAAACKAISDGATDYAAIEARSMQTLSDAGLAPEYFSVRRAFDLTPAGPQHMNLVVLTAARLGDVRLIDNMLVSRPR